MSFSSELKNELCMLKLPSDKIMQSELIGFIRSNGSITINFQGDVSLRFETTAGYIARRLFKIIKSLYNYDSEISVINDEQLRKKNLYQVKVSDEISRFILEDSGYSIGDFGYIEAKENFNILNEVKLDAFLRGAFLGGGTMVDPNKSYHIEIVCDTEESAQNIFDISKELGLNMKIVQRNDVYAVYLKEGDLVSDFLSIIGANNALLKFENIRALKDIRNSVNRMVNAETSNLNRQIAASVKQTNAIEKIEDTIGLNSLDRNLREVAIVRLANPNDSLKEIGEKLPNPLGKSGVNHRLKKIIEIADNL